MLINVIRYFIRKRTGKDQSAIPINRTWTLIATSIAVVATAVVVYLNGQVNHKPFQDFQAQTAQTQDAQIMPVAVRKCPRGLFCKTVKHYYPDKGYGPAFKVKCALPISESGEWTDISIKYVPAGHNSKEYCPNVWKIYQPKGAHFMRYNRTVTKDGYYYYWSKMHWGTGWHTFNNTWSPALGMVLQKN